MRPSGYADNHTKFSILLIAEKNETFPPQTKQSVQACFMMAIGMHNQERGLYGNVSQHDDRSCEIR